MKSNWEVDKAIEENVIEWLEENFFKKDVYITYYEINHNNLKNQKAGIDLILSTADGVMNKSKVDVKIASTYVNANLPTFAFETSSLKAPYLDKKKSVPGWFIDDEKETEFYIIGWIWADVPIKYYNNKGYPVYDWEKIKKDNITKIELYIIRRQDVKNYLLEKGWTHEKIIRQDKKIRDNESVETNEYVNDIKFTITKREKLPESPINIVLKKKNLKEIAIYVKEVRKEGEL